MFKLALHHIELPSDTAPATTGRDLANLLKFLWGVWLVDITLYRKHVIFSNTASSFGYSSHPQLLFL
jgi:hypothetical protein